MFWSSFLDINPFIKYDSFLGNVSQDLSYSKHLNTIFPKKCICPHLSWRLMQFLWTLKQAQNKTKADLSFILFPIVIGNFFIQHLSFQLLSPKCWEWVLIGVNCRWKTELAETRAQDPHTPKTSLFLPTDRGTLPLCLQASSSYL